MSKQGELIPGTNRDLTKSQWFTDPELAKRFVQWCKVGAYGTGDRYHQRVLEPAAGNGALVRPLIAAGCEVVAIELDERFADTLSGIVKKNGYIACPTDFLQISGGSTLLGPFDAAVMNSPFEETPECPLGQDVAFVLHALLFAPRVCAVLRSAIQHGVERNDGFWSMVRMTRKVDLMRRPNFHKGSQQHKGAQSDFILAELWARDARDVGGPDNVVVERWCI